jgi:TPR repeat protein
MEGRTTSAILWFRRAIAAGDPDARFDLAKMLLEDPDRCVEAVRLLREYVARGPQEIYEVRPPGENGPRVRLDVRLEDEDFEEAKRLLQELKGSISA